MTDTEKQELKDELLKIRTREEYLKFLAPYVLLFELFKDETNDR